MTKKKDKAPAAKPKAPAPPAAAEDQDRVEALVRWAKSHERAVLIAAAIVAVAGGGVWFVFSAKARREAFAQRELNQAQSAVDAGNLPLAASDLERITSRYGSTVAGQEAQLLLGQVHLQQGQAGLAVKQLQDYVASDPIQEFRAQAYDLLGVALEQTGQFQDAGKAYETGAGDSPYRFLTAKLLVDAGRSYTAAGDTAAAVRVLKRVADEFSDAPAAPEAQIRLGELGIYSG
jgi:predicted negative regulator of RcsB-dependent stress response